MGNISSLFVDVGGVAKNPKYPLADSSAPDMETADRDTVCGGTSTPSEPQIYGVPV